MAGGCAARAYNSSLLQPNDNRVPEGVARVQTYSEVIDGYEYHPEAKFADAQGNRAGSRLLVSCNVGT